MFEIIKDPTFAERNIPLGILEVTYPDRSAWDITKFYDLVHAELDALREKYADYDRKAVFGENPYFRFFKKFKKTYPVMQQFESVMFKGRPFPEEHPVMGVPFLLELTTFVLSGTHDIDRPDSRHVFHPVFGTPDTDKAVIENALRRLEFFVKVLAPDAEIESRII